MKFDNGELRLFNAGPLIEQGTVFECLKDIDAFRRVYLDDQHCVSWDIDPSVDSSKVWNNKIDLDPDSCYMDSVPV